MRRASLLTELASVEVTHAPEASDRRLVRVIGGPGGEAVGPQRVRAADLLMARGSTEPLREAVTGALAAASLSSVDRAAIEAIYLLAIDGPHDGSALTSLIPERADDPARSATLAWHLVVRGHDRERTRVLAKATLAAGHRAPMASRIIASRALLLCDDVAEAELGLDAVLVRRDA